MADQNASGGGAPRLTEGSYRFPRATRLTTFAGRSAAAAPETSSTCSAFIDCVPSGVVESVKFRNIYRRDFHA